MADKNILSSDAVAAAGVPGWEPFSKKLRTRYLTGDFATGLTFVQQIGQAAEKANHHPDVVLRYGSVDIALSSHDVGGLTQRDIDLARVIGALADDLGIKAAPDEVSEVEFGLDTPDHAAIQPFWAAILGLNHSPDEPEIVDPSGQVPNVWFQESEPNQAGPQRWHPDIWIPLDALDARIEAAIAAGGTLVDESERPTFTVLADPQGNRACLCTRAQRSH